jgi:hypothetical protein
MCVLCSLNTLQPDSGSLSHWNGDFGGSGFLAGPHWSNDDLIFIDMESLARAARAARGERGGGSGGSGASTYISGDPAIPDGSEFNVKLSFQGAVSADLRNAFILAAETISDIILGDIPAAGSGRRGAIDDITVTARLITIDGVGGILGQAGPTSIRVGSYLPATGIVELDSADAASYQAQGLLNALVLHEMFHTIGYGTIWSYLGLYTGGGFNGARANAVYPGSALIPVELDGGAGTAWAHWNEETFFNELMTGYLDGDNYLSYMTIASLGDLGYNVVSGASYVPPAFI